MMLSCVKVLLVSTSQSSVREEMRLAAPHPAVWDCAITHETDRQRTDCGQSLTDVVS